MTSSKKVFVLNRRILFSSTPPFPLTNRVIDVPVIIRSLLHTFNIHWKAGDWKVTESLKSVLSIFVIWNRKEQNVSESGHISVFTYEGENAPSLFGSSRRS